MNLLHNSNTFFHLNSNDFIPDSISHRFQAESIVTKRRGIGKKGNEEVEQCFNLLTSDW